jgi:hypothetical protein
MTFSFVSTLFAQALLILALHRSNCLTPLTAYSPLINASTQLLLVVNPNILAGSALDPQK